MTTPIITLTTDFGLRDPYVSEMKAAILGICQKAVVVDISHQIEKFNVRMGAFTLAVAAPYFPKGTIHVAVIDPSVGSERKPILIQTKHAFLVGPDNGLLALAAKKLGSIRAYEITNKKMMLPKVSRTFHGRDIFAPTAAHLANRIPPREFGPELSIVTPGSTQAVRKKNEIIGEVLYIDDFGNIVTNITEEELTTVKIGECIHININKHELELGLHNAYAEAKPKELLAIFGSHSFVEISMNQGNAARELNAQAGDRLAILTSQRK